MSSITSSIVRLLHRHRNQLISVGLVLVALPFVALSFYNHPALDDILDAVTVKQLGFWPAQKHFYNTLTGRYTTTLLLASVNPLIYLRMESHWWVVALGFIVGTWVVLRLCLGLLPGLPRGAASRGAGVLLGLWLAYAPGQAEGLYWFTGAYTYVATAWLLLLWVVVFVRCAGALWVGANNRSWLALLCGLTVAVAGTTEPVALPFLLVLLVGAALSVWRRKQWQLVLLAGLAVLGTAVSFSAPGNVVRMQFMGNSFGIAKTLAYSAASSGYLLLTWLSNPVLLAVSALLIPALYRVAVRRQRFLVAVLSRIPAWLLAGGLSLLMVTANCPAYYASGTGLPLRARTTLYLLFLVGWFGVLFTWCCRQALPERPSAVLTALASGRLAPLWSGLLVLFFFADHNVQTRASMLGHGNNNVLRAYRQWLGGEAAGYDAELRARYQTLNAGQPVATIRPLRTRPDLLFSFDVADSNNIPFLQGYAYYFGVQQVLLAPKTR